MKESEDKKFDAALVLSALGGIGFGFWQNSIGAGAFAVVVLIISFGIAFSLGEK